MTHSSTNPRSGQYLTHAHSHITRAVAAMDSCFGLIRPHHHGIAVRQKIGLQALCTLPFTAEAGAKHPFKVIPQYCIAHLYCARFSRHQRAHMSACSCKTWRICLDIELCQLKNGCSAPTSMGTPTFFSNHCNQLMINFVWGKTNLISIAENWINNENRK